jgi:drug/metabolite transporter (DMT)-like permease
MRPLHWVLLIALSILWGGTFVFAKEALPYVPPLTLTLSRVVIASVVLVPIVFALGLRLPKTQAQWRDFAGMAILNNIIPFGLIFWGQTMIGSGLTSVMNATTPLMALLVARVLAGEALAANKVAGVALGIGGVAVLVGPSALAGDKASALGMLLVVAGTLSYGLSALWGRRFKDVPPIVSAASQLVCSSLMMIPLAGFADQFWKLPMPPLPAVVAVVALGVLSTALAYILFFKIMAEAGSNNAMLVTLLIPISAISLGALRFGETLSLNQMIGAAIIAASLLVIDGRLFGFGGAPAVKSSGAK